MLADAPSCFYHNSGHKPVRILFYRDGVSEGKFERVSTTEVKVTKLVERPYYICPDRLVLGI
jgi:hypothetical protein